MTVRTEYNKETKEAVYILEFEDPAIGSTIEETNNLILSEFYEAVEWLWKKNYEEYREEESNTINPAQQNIFIPLRVYRVLKNGHYRTFKIFARCLGGICITET